MAVVKAVLEGSKHVTIRVHYLTKLPRGFPKGIIVQRDGDFDVRRINASRLLKWLHERGCTPITMETLRAEQIRLTMRMKELLNDDL